MFPDADYSITKAKPWLSAQEPGESSGFDAIEAWKIALVASTRCLSDIPKISTGRAGIPEWLGLKSSQKTEKALEAAYLLDRRHKKRRPWTSLIDHLVEPGGFEPPSASTPLSVLHA